MAPAHQRLLLALAYAACVDARFGHRGVGRPLPLLGQTQQLHRASRIAQHYDSASMLHTLRGGGNGIEDNPEYEETDDDSETERSDVSDDETEEQSDDDEDTLSSTSKKSKQYNLPKVLIATSKSSKKNSSPNKRLRKLVKRNQFNLYTLLAIIAFRQEIINLAMQILPTTTDPTTGKRRITIRWSTDILKLVVLGIFGAQFARNYFIENYTTEVVEEGDEEGNSIKNQTHSLEQQSPQPRPILPLLLILSLLFVPSIRRNVTMFAPFLLPLIVRALSGESDPDSPLGRLMLMFGKDGTDLATKMAYMPPLEQHYAFEQLNEKYWRDWGAWRKAYPTNHMITGSDDYMTSNETAERTAGHEHRGPIIAGGGMASMVTSLLSYRGKPRPRQPSQRTASKSTDTAPLSKTFPTKYNHGTAIVLDMTKLDMKASKMETIRDQISFVINLVHNEDSSLLTGKTDKGQEGSDVANNATLANSTETASSTSQSSEPIVEVIVLLESPGGGVSQYGLAASHLQRLRSTPNIKLTICIDEVAASGGYMMACMASPGQLYCAPFAMVGSIGVIGQSLNIQKTLESYGVRPYVFRGGKMKNPVGMVGDVTKDGVAAMQDSIDRIHVAFREHVASARTEAFTQALESGAIAKPAGSYFQMGSQGVGASLPSASIEQVMDQVATGDVFLGVQALKLGLVDRLITSDEYISERISQGSRVLKLINYHRHRPSLFMPPPQRSVGMTNLLKRVMHRMTTALLAWAEDDLTSRTVPNVSAGGVDDFQIS